MDVMTKEQRSRNMSRIRGKNTIPEMLLRKGLWTLGFRYRIHYPLPGKPDIVFTAQKIAVFVDGCFWHGCPSHGVKPKTNSSFWEKKLSKNIERDRNNQILIEQMGWTILRFWEHDIESNLAVVIQKITRRLRGIYET